MNRDRVRGRAEGGERGKGGEREGEGRGKRGKGRREVEERGIEKGREGAI